MLVSGHCCDTLNPRYYLSGMRVSGFIPFTWLEPLVNIMKRKAIDIQLSLLVGLLRQGRQTCGRRQ